MTLFARDLSKQHHAQSVNRMKLSRMTDRCKDAPGEQRQPWPAAGAGCGGGSAVAARTSRVYNGKGVGDANQHVVLITTSTQRDRQATTCAFSLLQCTCDQCRRDCPVRCPCKHPRSAMKWAQKETTDRSCTTHSGLQNLLPSSSTCSTRTEPPCLRAKPFMRCLQCFSLLDGVAALHLISAAPPRL